MYLYHVQNMHVYVATPRVWQSKHVFSMMLVFHIDVVLSFIRKKALILSKQHRCLSLLITIFFYQLPVVLCLASFKWSAWFIFLINKVICLIYQTVTDFSLHSLIIYFMLWERGLLRPYNKIIFPSQGGVNMLINTSLSESWG